MARTRTPTRALATLFVVAAVVLAGCSALSGDPTTTTAATTQTTTTAQATTTTTTTTTQTTTATTTTQTAADASTGSMTVVLGGSGLALQGSSGPVTFAEGERTWSTTSANVTVADALAPQGVELTNDTLSYSDKSFDGAQDGTTVSVRVNGETVDPTTYTLSDGDSVWVFASSPESDITPPGTYLDEGTDHQHGTIEVVVDGERLDLSQERFQEQNHYFHLENGNGERWHAHTWDATLGWSLGTLGFDVGDHAVTYNGTTYDANDPSVTAKVLVNGERVPPSYRLKDGDQIRIVLDDGS